MLKALELFGFKSFADRTRLEFPPGITVIVGPNGSGKSNIVDAIKWVLGEQSAKSLRGKEMADVIFKGSGQSGRKPMNAAEATLVFENADRRLPVDAPEVHITRRVYRSGEGEYLINRQPARLKDIRDMFRGTGVGVDAYSLIEQGKVDRMLQASARDRRAIFEEAAGISRFKAKKVEAQRRLERVEQNLLRLADIVEEVENRLKTVRNQAGKARRYREYSERLQALRTQIARADWQRLGERLAAVEQELAALVEQIHSSDAQAQRLEAEQLELEAAVATAAEELRNCETRVAQARQQRSQHEATIAHEQSRIGELADEAGLHRRNLLAMSDRAGDVRTRLKETEAEVAAAEEAQSQAAAGLTRRQSQLAELTSRHDEARREAESARGEHVSRLQTAAGLATQVEAAQSQLAIARQTERQHLEELPGLAAAEGAVREQLAAAGELRDAMAGRLLAHQQALEAAHKDLAENRNLYASRAEDLAGLHSRHHGVAQRHDVLEEFERTLEGLGAGVKQVLKKAGLGSREAKSPAEPPRSAECWSHIRGVVADFLDVRVEHAAAIDAALGEFAQAIVVDGGPEVIRQIVAAADDLTDRVVAVSNPVAVENAVLGNQYSVLGSAAILAARSTHDPIELSSEVVQGVRIIARADKLIECAGHDRPLVTLLLGRTFVVHALDDAIRLLSQAPPETRAVTLAGEWIDEHSAIHFGPRHVAVSLVSRRSQLRAARLDLAVLEQQIADASRETQHLKREAERHEQAVRRLVDSGRSLDREAAAAHAAHETLRHSVEHSRQRWQSADAARAAAAEQCAALEGSLTQLSEDLSAAHAAARSAETAAKAREQALTLLDAERQAAAEQVTNAKIELARCQQRLESLRLRLSQFEADQRERDSALSQVRQLLCQAQQRQEAAELSILGALSQIAGLALAIQTLDGQVAGCAKRRDEAQSQRGHLADELADLRRRALQLRDQEHQLELSAEQVRHERRTLADRLREDYGIELADLTHQPTAEEAQERAAVLEEIETLRRKINQIGAVNLDALDELDQLEQRFATLDGQHKDLTEAKQALERIIHKINADSRRLFLETLEAIRVNFQALYRKAFGGGKADIVLEEGVDVLECGVEIIATPPGKPSFNNSLLSGGEKALTAVALLLAIFQFRPSPFCVLDEVDAPFDEANIGRFIDVLHEFLGWTRFVIVTHSKKTMTAATTLYGVTMQESGVSKRVSVRFDDVSDDGHIRHEALERVRDQESSEQRGVA